VSEAQGTAAGPSHGDARVWWRIGWLSFGGPAGQIALMQRELVEQRRWIELPQFLAALNFCMLLPGPEAQQLATYIGWHRRGWRGALVAGGLFVLPGMAVMLALSIAYVRYGRVPWVDGLMFGVRCAVAAIVLEALWRIGRRALVFRGALTVAVAAFVALFAFAVPYPAVVAIAALAGWILGRRDPPLAHIDDDAPHRAPTPAPVLLAVACAWLAPLALLGGARGADDSVVRLGALKTAKAVVTIGGA
jgi:chromate transporter